MAFMVTLGRRVVRSDILLPASQFRRLSRAIRTTVRAIFSGHFKSAGAVGIRIEQPIGRSSDDRKISILWNAA
jgi:hypothetical protein